MQRARRCVVDVHSPGPAFQKPSYFSFQKNYYNCMYMYMYMVLTTCVLTCTCTLAVKDFNPPSQLSRLGRSASALYYVSLFTSTHMYMYMYMCKQLY